MCARCKDVHQFNRHGLVGIPEEAQAAWISFAPLLSAFFAARRYGLMGGIGAFLVSKWLIEHRQPMGPASAITG